jgi:hypothetical protein
VLGLREKTHRQVSRTTLPTCLQRLTHTRQRRYFPNRFQLGCIPNAPADRLQLDFSSLRLRLVAAQALLLAVHKRSGQESGKHVSVISTRLHFQFGIMPRYAAYVCLHQKLGSDPFLRPSTMPLALTTCGSSMVNLGTWNPSYSCLTSALLLQMPNSIPSPVR